QRRHTWLESGGEHPPAPAADFCHSSHWIPATMAAPPAPPQWDEGTLVFALKSERAAVVRECSHEVTVGYLIVRKPLVDAGGQCINEGRAQVLVRGCRIEKRSKFANMACLCAQLAKNLQLEPHVGLANVMQHSEDSQTVQRGPGQGCRRTRL